MNTIQDPVPFAPMDDEFAPFSELTDELDSINHKPGKSVNIIYIPTAPIPAIPPQRTIISQHNDLSWIHSIPKGIVIDPNRICILLPDQSTVMCSVDTFHDTIWNTIKDSTIEIHVHYHIQLIEDSSLEGCLTMNQSIGESSLFVNYLQSYPIRQRVRYRQNPADIPPRRSSYLEVNGDQLQSMIQTLIERTTQVPTWEDEHETLINMGFTNRNLNSIILSRTMGDVNRAVELLVVAQQDNSN